MKVSFVLVFAVVFVAGGVTSFLVTKRMDKAPVEVVDGSCEGLRSQRFECRRNVALVRIAEALEKIAGVMPDPE